MKREDEPFYADAVWEMFRLRHQPHRLIASNSEGMLIRRWIDAQVPLPIVERGIRETSGQPRTLLACEQAVTRAYGYWREAMGGL